MRKVDSHIAGEQDRNDMESSKAPKEGRDTAVATGVDDGIKPARVQEKS
jgi:hypothetical protein